MQLASSLTGDRIVLVVAPIMVLLLGTRFVLAYRNNQRMANEHFGGLTRTESSLSRVHAIAILGLLVGSMALAIGSVLSPTVRDALAAVGEQSPWLPFATIPVALLYGRWLTRQVRRANAERAARH